MAETLQSNFLLEITWIIRSVSLMLLLFFGNPPNSGPKLFDVSQYPIDVSQYPILHFIFIFI